MAFTFILLEPRLLCTHCPFYQIEGNILKCGALWGIPTFWGFRPEAVNSKKQYIMLIFGSIIDLVPFVGIIYGLILFFQQLRQ
ncbi:hypothetical protein [Candidatus Harpocratesius sp.]